MKKYRRTHCQPTDKTANTVRQIIETATQSAAYALQGRQREVTVVPTHLPGGAGWDAMEFTRDGGSWLASNVTWPEAVNAALRFVGQVLPGLTPNIEIRLGHPQK